MFSTSDGYGPQGDPSLSLSMSAEMYAQDRFTREIESTVLPKRRGAPGQINPEYQAKLVELHGAILGVTALFVAINGSPFKADISRSGWTLSHTLSLSSCVSGPYLY